MSTPFTSETPPKSSQPHKYLTPQLKKSHKPPKTLKHTSLPFFKPPRYPEDSHDQLHIYQQTLIPFNTPNKPQETFQKPRETPPPNTSKPQFTLQRNMEPMNPMNPQNNNWRSQRTSMNEPPKAAYLYQEPKLMCPQNQFMPPMMPNSAYFSTPPYTQVPPYQMGNMGHMGNQPMFGRREVPQQQRQQGKMQNNYHNSQNNQNNKIMRSRFMTKSLPENVKQAGIFRSNDQRSKNFQQRNLHNHGNRRHPHPHHPPPHRLHQQQRHQTQEVLPEDVRLKIGQAPLEPLSAYQLFVKDRCVELKKTNPNLPHKEALAQANDAWLRDLSSEDKEAWQCKYEENSKAYRKQMNEFRQRKGEILKEYYEKVQVNDWRGNEEKEEKIKFKTPFRLFKLDRIEKLKEENPNVTFRERVSMMKQLWKDLSPHAKFLYVQRSRLDKEKYRDGLFLILLMFSQRALLERKMNTVLEIQQVKKKSQEKDLDQKSETSKPPMTDDQISSKEEENSDSDGDEEDEDFAAAAQRNEIETPSEDTEDPENESEARDMWKN